VTLAMNILNFYNVLFLSYEPGQDKQMGRQSDRLIERFVTYTDRVVVNRVTQNRINNIVTLQTAEV